MRSRISRAARSVKVMATNWLNRERPAGAVRLQFGQESLGQHEGLAAAGAGRERNRRAPGGNGPLLLVGQARGLHWLAVGWHVFSKERT